LNINGNIISLILPLNRCKIIILNIQNMIKIYGTENSRAMRPIWTAQEMGLDYKLIMMPFPPRVL
jgi:hypothetical protein